MTDHRESDPITRRVTTRMKMFRERLGLSQRELGERLGCNRLVYQAWEGGRNQMTIGQVQAVADALNVPLSALVGDDSDLVDPVLSAQWRDLDPDTQDLFKTMVAAAHEKRKNRPN